MRRRQFLSTSLSVTVALPALLERAAAAIPCPPAQFGVQGGTTTNTSCIIGSNYPIPAQGQATAIGVNTANDIRPSGYSAQSWGYSLFNNYGSGTFAPEFSARGAFVIAASGGHGVPPNVDAAIFDFSDAAWKRLPNANGITPREADYTVSETSGSPYYELQGATAGQIPAPIHLYQLVAYIPPALGGGPKGSYLKVGSPTATVSSVQAGGIHRMDLSTGLWTRVTNDTISAYLGYSYNANTVYDPVSNRFYFLSDSFFVFNSVAYLDPIDWRVKTTSPTYSPPAAQQGPGYQTVFLDPVRRLLVAQRRGFALRALDLQNIGAGWVNLNVSGNQPAEYENRWAFYEPDGNFYTRGNRSGQELTRLKPPAGDWKTGVWAYSQVTVGGAAMPNHSTTGGETAHQGAFFYVPSIQCLAWVAAEDKQVVILKPPA